MKKIIIKCEFRMLHVVTFYPATGNIDAEPAFYAELYNYAEAMARGVCSKHQLTDELCEDLRQDLILVALSNIGAYAGRAKFSTWLNSIWRNNICDMFRRDRNREKYGLDNKHLSCDSEHLSYIVAQDAKEDSDE